MPVRGRVLHSSDSDSLDEGPRRRMRTSNQEAESDDRTVADASRGRLFVSDSESEERIEQAPVLLEDELSQGAVGSDAHQEHLSIAAPQEAPEVAAPTENDPDDDANFQDASTHSVGM